LGYFFPLQRLRINIDKNVGIWLNFGRFFSKLIWSPWSAALKPLPLLCLPAYISSFCAFIVVVCVFVNAPCIHISATTYLHLYMYVFNTFVRLCVFSCFFVVLFSIILFRCFIIFLRQLYIRYIFNAMKSFHRNN
jgi:hypothetical protein